MRISKENGTGPNAFSDLAFPNQHVWNTAPGKLWDAALDSLATGGFDGDHISRQVGNWEGQVAAIRAGLVDGLSYSFRESTEPWIDVWRINELGRSALREAKKPVPIMLPARDDWHSRVGSESTFEYCVYELTRNEQPVLRLMEKPIPCGANWGMDPLLCIGDVITLRDYLNDWLLRFPCPTRKGSGRVHK